MNVALILWTLYCLYLQKTNLSIYQSRALQTWIFFWTLFSGLLISCVFSCCYLFVSPYNPQLETTYNLLNQIDRSLNFVLVFTIPNICIQLTVFQFIMVICWPLHIKRSKAISLVIASAVVLISAGINTIRVIVYKNPDSAASRIFYQIDQALEVCIAVSTAALCVWFFVIYARIHQRRQEINFITVADRGNKAVTFHLTVCALVCVVADLTSMVLGWARPSWYCGWEAAVFQWIDLAIYIISLTISFTPFLCKHRTDRIADDETSSLYETF